MTGWVDAPTVWRRWVALLSHREPGTGLALFRFGLGVCALYTIGSVGWADLVDVLWVDRSLGGVRALPRPPWLVEALGGARPEVVWPLVMTSLGASALLTVGLGGRLTALVTLQTVLPLTDLNAHAGGSYDALLQNGLWLLVLAPSTATLSADAYLRTGHVWDPRPVPAWPRYVAVFQLVLMYGSTGMQKLAGGWTPMGGFSALYYIFQQPTWQRYDLSFMAWVYPLTQAGTFVAWAWEISAPLWLLAFWYRATRTRSGRLRALFNAWEVRSLYAAVGAAMHVVLLAFMNVGPFPGITLAYYFCLYHPDEYAALWRRGSRRFSSSAPARPPVDA